MEYFRKPGHDPTQHHFLLDGGKTHIKARTYFLFVRLDGDISKRYLKNNDLIEAFRPICQYIYSRNHYTMSSKINKEWHLAHKMPKNPNIEQRIEWHLEHAKHCECRKIEGKIAEEMKKRGIQF